MTCVALSLSRSFQQCVQHTQRQSFGVQLIGLVVEGGADAGRTTLAAGAGANLLSRGVEQGVVQVEQGGAKAQAGGDLLVEVDGR